MKNNQSLVSVIIPTYNRAHLIGETLDSVLAQTYQNWECIIVDDGSSDNTDEVVGKYVKSDSRFKYYHLPEEHLPGGNGARNYGFNVSQGEYIQWFDSDDIMDKDLIRLQYYSLSNNNLLASANVCQFKVYYEDIEKAINIYKDNFLTYGLKYDYVIGSFKMNLQTIFFKKELVNNYSLSEKLKKSQEVEFLHRLLKEHEASFSFINNRLVFIRRHSNSITNSENPNFYNDRMYVLKTIIHDFNIEAPANVNSILYYKYLKSLKFFYYRKLTMFFLKNLNFIPSIKYKVLFTLSYVLFYFFNIGSTFYNKTIFKFKRQIQHAKKSG